MNASQAYIAQLAGREILALSLVVAGPQGKALGLAAHSVVLALELSELAGDPEAEIEARYLETHPAPIPVSPDQMGMFVEVRVESETGEKQKTEEPTC